MIFRLPMEVSGVWILSFRYLDENRIEDGFYLLYGKRCSCATMEVWMHAGGC